MILCDSNVIRFIDYIIFVIVAENYITIIQITCIYIRNCLLAYFTHYNSHWKLSLRL
jgi:hypothetical protein